MDSSIDDDVLIEMLKVPTAYNVESVIVELEEYRANFDCEICKYNKTESQVCTKDCTDALIDGLFEIVKNGWGVL